MNETVEQARLAVLAAQAALHSAMAALCVSGSLAGVRVAKVAVATALVCMEEILGEGAAEPAGKPRCARCGSDRILESQTSAGVQRVCGACGEDPGVEA